MSDTKTEILTAILTDNLDRANKLLNKYKTNLKLLRHLMGKIKPDTPPLNKLKSALPPIISISTSVTCGLGCKMCGIGFSNQSFLQKNYKHLDLEQFNELLPWIKTSQVVSLVGLGETLESPFTHKFIQAIKDKISIIITNGLPLTGEKIHSLIKSKLHYIVFSFDGKTSVGHGSGKDIYFKKFWERVKLIQKIKNELNCKHPVLSLVITIDRENIYNLEDILQTALYYEIKLVFFSIMFPIKKDLFSKAILSDYVSSKEKINTIIKKWNKKGLDITIFEKQSMGDTLLLCRYIDKNLVFNMNRNLPSVCCGTITMPIETGGLSTYNYWNSFPFRYFRYLHMYSDRKNLPVICKECWELDWKRYVNVENFTFSKKEHNRENNIEAMKIYETAGSIKKADPEQAKRLYLKTIDLSNDISIQGKAYFHIGEIHIASENYHKALQSMKKSVQHCFNHQSAFAYLYILIILTEDSLNNIQKKSINSDFVNKLIKHSPFT